MSSNQDSYEIYAAAKKNWRLLTRVTTSGQAIEEATKLQHTEKYSAIQVIVRQPATDGAETASPRLLYQFTRPSARLLDGEPLLQSANASTAMVSDAPASLSAPANGGRPRRWLISVGLWGTVVAVLILIFKIAS